MSRLMLVYVLGCKYRPTARDLLVFAPVYDAYVCQPTYDFSTCIGGPCFGKQGNVRSK